MIIEQRPKILLFSLASGAVHIVALAFLVAPLLTSNISIGPLENSKPLQISLQAITSPLTHSETDTQLVQTANQPESRAAVSAATPKNNFTQKEVREINPGIIKQEKIPERHEPAEKIIEPASTNVALEDTSTVAVTLHQEDKERSAEQHANIQEKLDAVFDKYFSYPSFAVRRGWQGTVEIALRIEANGKLSNMRVIKTSGYRYLDQDALTTLSKADHINGLDAWLAGRHFDTTLPVEYRLTGG